VNVTTTESTVLQELARRVREIAALDQQQRKRDAVIALNGLRSERPVVYCFPEGAWLECIPTDTLRCEDPVLRSWETRLRMAIYTHEHLADDQPIDAVFNVYLDGGMTGWGIEQHLDMPGDADRRQIYYVHPCTSLSLVSHSRLGAYHIDPPMKSRDDLAKLRVPQLRVNCERSDLWLSVARDILGDILEVRRRGCFWTIVGGVPATAMALRGMDNLWLDLYDDPQWVHAFVAFLAEAHNAQLDALEDGGWLTLNNEAEWIGTGGIGYTDQLPQADFDPAHVRLADIWGGLQSQDLVGISPAMFAEFFFEPLKPIMERFGLSHYGCCEPLHDWLATLMGVGNLRRVSISPWADVRACAEQMAGDYVFSYKPLPTPMTTEHMDEDGMGALCRRSLEATKEHGCHVEIMMKDLHTVRGRPERLRRWVEIARQAIDEVYG